MVKKADIPKHIVDTALALAAERGWRGLKLVDIAQPFPRHRRSA